MIPHNRRLIFQTEYNADGIKKINIHYIRTLQKVENGNFTCSLRHNFVPLHIYETVSLLQVPGGCEVVAKGHQRNPRTLIHQKQCLFHNGLLTSQEKLYKILAK